MITLAWSLTSYRCSFCDDRDPGLDSTAGPALGGAVQEHRGGSVAGLIVLCNTTFTATATYSPGTGGALEQMSPRGSSRMVTQGCVSAVGRDTVVLESTPPCVPFGKHQLDVLVGCMSCTDATSSVHGSRRV